MKYDQWPRLELRQLETFRAIATTGSFHAAAEQLGHAQSVVSQQLRTLETVVGARLLDRGRGRRSVSLTEAGTVLLRHAEAIAARVNAARADLQAIAEGSSGTLRVGTYQSVSARILPSVLRLFAERWPGVGIEVRESAEDRALLPQVEAGELDLAFTALPIANEPFEAVEVLRDRWFLLTQPDSPLVSQASPLAVLALQGLPLLGYGTTSGVQILLEEYLRGSGLSPNLIFRTNDNVAIHELVASGFGSALMPALAVNADDQRVACIPLDIPPRSIAIAWHGGRTMSPASRAFIETVQQVCTGLGAEAS